MFSNGMGGATETLGSDSTKRTWWNSLEKGSTNCFTGVNSIPQVNDFYICRYPLGGTEMPMALPWFQQKIGLDISQTSYSQVGKQ